MSEGESAIVVHEAMPMYHQLRCLQSGGGARRTRYIGAAARQSSVQALDKREGGHQKVQK